MKCKNAKPGIHGDGNGLYLRVWPSGSRSWIQRLVIQGKRTDLGLGSFPVVSLAEAREKAFENRRIARNGGNPKQAKAVKVSITFREASEKSLEHNQEAWKGGADSTHATIWRGQLALHAFPVIGEKPVDTITQDDVVRVLLPVWDKPDTSRRLLLFMRQIFRWCKAHKYLETSDYPTNEIEEVLPRGGSRGTYRFLPYGEAADALDAIAAYQGSMAAKFCLHFVVLTAVRSGEARGARWSEIDISARSWTIPADRTKTGEVHRVPLSDAAVAVLESARMLDDGSDLVFPSSQKRGCQMTAHTLQKVLRETGLAERTVVHGFRKSFHTWADDKTKADWAVKELCLGHAVGNKVERTYATSDLFERRRRLMEQWAAFATGERGKVVRMSA